MARAGSTPSNRRVGFFDPTVPILLAALAVHVVRRNVFDIVVFAATVALICVDRWRPLPVRRFDRVWGSRPVMAGTVVVFGALVGWADVGSWPVRIALALAGLAALLVLTGARPAIRPGAADPGDGGARRPVGRGWLVWAGLLVIAALIELANFLQQPDPQTGSYRHPTLSTLIEPLLASPVFRMVTLAVWAAAGWWLIRACCRMSNTDTVPAGRTVRPGRRADDRPGPDGTTWP